MTYAIIALAAIAIGAMLWRWLFTPKPNKYQGEADPRNWRL